MLPPQPPARRQAAPSASPPSLRKELCWRCSRQRRHTSGSRVASRRTLNQQHVHLRAPPACLPQSVLTCVARALLCHSPRARFAVYDSHSPAGAASGVAAIRGARSSSGSAVLFGGAGTSGSAYEALFGGASRGGSGDGACRGDADLREKVRLLEAKVVALAGDVAAMKAALRDVTEGRHAAAAAAAAAGAAATAQDATQAALQVRYQYPRTHSHLQLPAYPPTQPARRAA